MSDRDEFEKWFEGSRYAMAKVSTREAMYDAWRAARAQQVGIGEAIGEITSVEGSIMFEPGRYRQDAVFKELYPIGTKLYAHPQAAQQGSVPEVCDWREQDAFEVYASRKGCDMTQHPLHYLFINDKTNAARHAWKAAISYCHEVATTPQPADNNKKLQALRDSINGDCYMGEEWELKTIDELLSPLTEGAE